MSPELGYGTASIWHHAPPVFWPYRPRPGYPSVPRWLFFVILLAVVAVYVTVLSVLGHDPTDGPPNG